MVRVRTLRVNPPQIAQMARESTSRARASLREFTTPMGILPRPRSHGLSLCVVGDRLITTTFAWPKSAAARCRGAPPPRREVPKSGLARVARFVRARAAIGSDAIDATLSTQVLPKPGACAGNFTFAGREDDGDVKLHAATVAESITNWPEVVAKLRGTRFEKYLTMDGSVLP